MTEHTHALSVAAFDNVGYTGTLSADNDAVSMSNTDGDSWTWLDHGNDVHQLIPPAIPDANPWLEFVRPPAKLECEYCGQVNKREREQCRSCGAPLLEE